MYRLATCDDLLALKSRHVDAHLPDSVGWGLKEMGRLFCLEQIHRLRPGAVLELGAGCDTFFSRRLRAMDRPPADGDRTEYWMIDRAGFYDETAFDEALSKRQDARFIDGLLGESSADLPASYFDLVFSVSVLEHVHDGGIDALCDEMHRVLKPGGWAVHSLDVWDRSSKIALYQEALSRAGFTFTEPPNVEFSIGHPKATLFEPLAIKFTYYNGRQENMWEDVKPITNHSATILIKAQRNSSA